MSSSPPKPAHLLLLGIVAVIAGGAWYLFDRQRPVDEQSLDELESTMRSTSLDLQEKLTVDIDTRQLAEERARAESEEGLRLAALCNAWIEFDTNHPSESTRENRDRSCGDYRRYVETGELPDGPAD